MSLAAAGIVLTLLGATFNAIVVAGLVLAIGIVVDDAVQAYAAVEERLASAVRRIGSAPARS